MSTYKQKLLYIIVGIFCCIIIISCGSSLKLWNEGDLQPPDLVSVKVIDMHTILLEYSENIVKERFHITILHNDTQVSSRDIPVGAVHVNNQLVTIITGTALEAGDEFILTAEAYDTKDNGSISIESVFGFNDRIPTLLINEFICEGSKSNPDKVELIVLEGGLLAGLALHQGGLHTYKTEVKFPKTEVEKGDFIIIHLSPDEQEAFSSEIQDKSESTHSQSFENAWDIFADSENRGLSNTNSSISIVNLVNQSILDAVIYSLRDDDPTHKYRGFYHSSVFEGNEEIVQSGQWNINDSHGGVLPSDAVNPRDSTTTRSIGRNSQSIDSNGKSDWNITPSRKSSFGAVNTDEVYAP